MDRAIARILNIRYEELFHAYYDQAIAGDVEATKIVVGIMEWVAKINGVIPDRSLVTVDHRALHLDRGGERKHREDRVRGRGGCGR